MPRYVNKKEHQEGVPTLVKECIEFINQNIVISGIFRIPGPNLKCQIVALKFSLGCNIDFTVYGGVHCACSLLKQFIRETPRKLLTEETLNQILVGANTNKQIVESIRKTLNSNDKQLYGELFKLLNHICEFETENKMNSYNLSIVWAPNFVTEVELIGSQKVQQFIKYCIESAINF